MTVFLDTLQVAEFEGIDISDYMFEMCESNWESVIETDEGDWLFVE
jgi:hypothetical protein